jgi:endonuclease I/chitodextrinase
MMKKLLILIFITSFSVSFSQEQYYYNVDLTLAGLQLKDALANKIISTHTNFLSYSEVWVACKNTDINPENSNEVVLVYGWEEGRDQDDTNDRTRDITLQDNGRNGSFVWNREHVYPKSLGEPNLETVGPGADAHHLRSADRTTNTSRSNKKFAEGSGNSGSVSNGWYPGDEWKGDVARMMMYMYLRYGDRCAPNNVGDGSTDMTEDNMIDLFLDWNVQDPVTQFEKDRNTYHENTSNSSGQGNRNPFIDNPYLATRIWGGDSAEDLWGIYTNSDSEAPTQPTNVLANNQTTTTIDLNWTASEDNVEVTGYNVYVDDVLTAQTSNISFQLTGLTPNTSYAIEIEALDLINNKSEKSTVINSTTTFDTTAPNVPANITASNISGTAFKINWNAVTDDTAVSAYKVFVDGSLIGSTLDLYYTLTGLTISTTYQISLSAKDAADNESSQSAAVAITTTDGQSNGINELFISEYAEPELNGDNKAIEIVNLTASSVNLSDYSIQKQSNGGSWVSDYPLGNFNIVAGDVFVIVHADTDNSALLDEADLLGPPFNSAAPYLYGSPLNFNGNDPIGLFKNGVLIDIIGEEGNSSNHIQNKTYRRKATVSEPNTRFDTSEWDILSANTYDGIGSHTSTLSIKSNAFQSFKMFPNPTNGNNIYFSVIEDATIHIYNVLGKLIQSSEVTKSKNSINISEFAKGIYLVKINSGKQFITKKLIKN